MADEPIRVLLVIGEVDDFTLTRALFADIEEVVYAVEWAPTAAKAMAQIASRSHEVYLIDSHVVEGTGIELLRYAQNIGTQAPMIFLTGAGEAGLDMAAMRAGASDFLIKEEMTPRSLERAVRYALERKRAELQIDKLAAFPRHNPNPMVEFNAAGVLSYSNAAADNMARSLGESSINAIFPMEIAQVVATCLRAGVSKSVQTAHGTRSFSWSFIPVPESKLVHGYATEITERLNFEAQLRHAVKMEAVGQLAAGVAHDFNNILTVIEGHANLILASRGKDPELSRPLKQICLVAERAGNLIRQLLMFSRKQVMHPRYLDVNEVVTNVSRILQRVLGEDITVEVIVHPNLPGVYGDAGMIEQVFMNLAVNARDAMPRGGKFTLATSLERFDETAPLLNPEARTGDFVCLSISDTGCGIDAVTLNRIFEPFFTTKEVGKGTGLGLATVYGIIKQHQGWVEVQSQVSLGTTFRIYLSATVRKPTSVPTGALEQRVLRGSETILVVEDEGPLRELVTEILNIYGYKVIAADSGVAALKVWEQHKDKVDLLLTDMVMPLGISGRELAEMLQDQAPKLKVIYTSGYSPGMAGKDLALLEGFNFLPKPYPPARLAEVVRECLDADRQLSW